MGLFGDIKNWIINKWKVSQNFDVYFKNFNKKLNSLTYVEETFDDKITRIYDQIKATSPQKYASQIQVYQRAMYEAKEHNKRVRIIEDGIIGFDYNQIVKDPRSFNYENIYTYDEIANLILKFSKRESKYDDFVQHVKLIKDYYNELVEEHDLAITYNQSSKIDKEVGYIDSVYKNVILSLRNSIRQKINSHQVTFNKLESDDVFINEIKKHNLDFIESNKRDTLFDDINKLSLDSGQRESILTDEVSTLVVAGAGSGKTLTICGKVKYLLERKDIKPTDILLLSYSRNSAEDLQRKVSKINDNVKVGTFHKIGLDILKETQNKTFVIEEQYRSIIEKYFREEMKNRPHVLKTILTYYALYISSNKYERKYKSKGELYEDLKKSDFSTLRSQLLNMTNNINKKETIKKELVKSFEEMAIANWYFINGIDYVYEGPYEKDVSTAEKRQYLPDFRLTKYKIYHEHYGINKNGKADQYEGNEAQAYLDSMQRKRTVHSQNNTICIETYSYEFEDGTVFQKLESELKNRGVVFNPLSKDQIFNAIESIYEGKTFKSFVNLVKTFLSLYKANYRNANGFNELKKYQYANNYRMKRADLFLDIAEDVYNYYMSYIRQERKIDYDDMILQAMDEIDKTNNYKYKYIIVDEFQDISLSRMKFLKKLIEHGNSRLFAVGDDWQAIYRFSGCDLSIFLRFSEYFGDSAITKITTTHRNSQDLQDIAGPFIKKNPEQFDKSIQSDQKRIWKPIRIMYYSDKKYNAFLNVLKEIEKINPKAEVLILGRNNKDLEDISLDSRIYIDYKRSTENTKLVKVSEHPNMKLTFNTVHGSKGLEAEFVIIINADDTRLGFPNKMEDDELLDMVLSSKSAYEYAEERRLWYVALTRTKSYTYIIASNNNPSIFVKEIENQCLIMNPNTEINREAEIQCPDCKTGKLILRSNSRDGNKFYGCSNYPYCKYSIRDIKAVKRNKRCPCCGDFMLIKKGPYGFFYGCHKYPRCKHKEEYNG